MWSLAATHRFSKIYKIINCFSYEYIGNRLPDFPPTVVLVVKRARLCLFCRSHAVLSSLIFKEARIPGTFTV